MSDRLEHSRPRLPVSNYGSAVARAVEWLGDRYLLANPINAGARTRTQPRRMNAGQGPLRAAMSDELPTT
jgi:hypothetical protein